MRLIASLCVALSLSFLLLTGAQADDAKETKGAKGKEVTLKGKITCAKCELEIEKKCATVIVTKVNDKQTVIYFDEVAGKKNHAKICKAPAEGSVTGVVKDDGKKKVIEVKDVKFD